jgi:DNA-binding winged helix-turn-helix (wHTH) protein/Tol biopolymer transport system component
LVPTTHLEHSRLRFGVFEVDLAAGELRKQGTRIRLQDQPFRMLAVLLESPGQVVTREELQKRLWSADTFVDFDRGLNKAINRLREALDDVAESPRFIETLPKRGYRFIAPVEQLQMPLDRQVGTAYATAVAALSGAETFADRVPAKIASDSSGFSVPRRETVAWAIAFLLLVACLLLATFSRRTTSSIPLPLRSSLLPPARLSFVPSQFAISPDGTELAFVALDQDGQTALWVRPLSGSGARRLDGSDEAALPFWSSDSRNVGFFASRKLKVVEISTGLVRVLADAPVGRGGAWNSDGVIVFTPTITGPLYRVDAAGGTPVAVTRISSAENGEIHCLPSFLPDGRHFLFYAFRRDPAQRPGNGLYVGTLGSSEIKLLSSEIVGNIAFASGRLIYVRERSLVAQPFDLARLQPSGPVVTIAGQELDPDPTFALSGFSVSESGVLVFQSTADLATHLTWFDRSGRELGAVTAATSLTDPSLSPDGRFLAASSDDGRNGQYYIRTFDLVRSVSTRITSGGHDDRPTWRPDGKTITYTADDGRAFEIRQVSADGSASPSPIQKGLSGYPSSWSPDGHLAWVRVGPGGLGLSVFSASDGTSRSLPPGVEAQFSPDGKWMAYIGEGGIAGGGGVVVQPFPGPGGRTQISEAGGAQPRWSRDGREIFYIAPNRTLMAVPFDVTVGTAGRAHPLFRTRIVAPNLAWFQYDVAPDGRFLINSFPSTSGSPLTFLTGWTSSVSSTP